MIEPAGIAEIVTGAVATPEGCWDGPTIDTLPSLAELEIHGTVCKSVCVRAIHPPQFFTITFSRFTTILIEFNLSSFVRAIEI